MVLNAEKGLPVLAIGSMLVRGTWIFVNINRPTYRLFIYRPWADPGGGGGPPPPFGPRCRLFNIGTKVGPPPGPPLFLLVDLRWTTPLFKNPGSAPADLYRPIDMAVQPVCRPTCF